MRHAMRAVRLNLKHGAEDHPVAAVVVGVILASGAFFGLLAIAHGCETKAAAACGLATVEKQMGGCYGAGVSAPRGIRRGSGPVHPKGCDFVGETSTVPTIKAYDALGQSGVEAESGQPPISLQAVAVPLVEGLRFENRTGRAAEREVPSAASARRLPRGADAKLAQARLVCFRVTAYCPCALCCGKFADGITASGTRADHRLVAAPREFPFGTEMRIPGYGMVRVEDRGGAIRGDRLDVLFPTHAAALVWGVRWMNVEISR